MNIELSITDHSNLMNCSKGESTTIFYELCEKAQIEFYPRIKLSLAEIQSYHGETIDQAIAIVRTLFKSQERAEKVLNCQKCIKKQDFCSTHNIYKLFLSAADKGRCYNSFYMKKNYV